MSRVVCIKKSKYLTIGKIYNARLPLDTKAPYLFNYYIKDDMEDGFYTWYHKSYFITYNEWLALEREKQMKSILDE